MFRRFFSRPRAYVWRPAIDLRDGRIAAALMTFAPN